MEDPPNIYDCKAYACYLKNEEKLLKSTSGGVFQEIAGSVISRGGVVFGAALTDDFEVRHQEADTLAGLEKILKSKYAQSQIGNSYKKARQYLQDGRLVLFSGTPCQIAGLKSFLGREYDTLLTVDLICHGVPSNKLFREHIQSLSSQYGAIYDFQFRDKENGWDKISVSYQLEKEKKVVAAKEDAFYYGFSCYYFLRPSCYECRYRNLRSGADITLGDYWGIQSFHPDFWNGKGISAVIVKTKKVERKKFYALWQKGERDLKSIYRRIEQSGPTVKIGVIGGYTSRKAILLCSRYDSSIQIGWHITNSGISSMVADRPEKPIDMAGLSCSNEYRQQSLFHDINKSLPDYLEEESAYIVIDFLEERFPVLHMENHLTVTESEAYQEIGEFFPLRVRERVPMLDMPVSEWQKNCLAFIALLKKAKKPEQIILNCVYLTENWGYDRPEEKFSGAHEIEEINARLKEYYRFFIENYEGIHIVDIHDARTDFCDKYFNLGCEPVNYNMFRYRQMRDKILEAMQQSEEFTYDNAEAALERYVFISGREDKVRELVSPYTDKEIPTVLDPTLAVEETFWEKAAAPPLIEGRYLCCYILGSVEHYRLSVERLRRKCGADRIVFINTDTIDGKTRRYSDYRMQDYKKTVGPAEFISLIKNAAAVCTDSYHGVCLSIVFQKDFYVFERVKEYALEDEYRFRDLFARLGIGNRIMANDRDIDMACEIDWEAVSGKLREEREKSIHYLKNAIQSV